MDHVPWASPSDTACGKRSLRLRSGDLNSRFLRVSTMHAALGYHAGCVRPECGREVIAKFERSAGGPNGSVGT